MASAVMDNAKAFANEQLATLRAKLNQVPVLEEVEVRECPSMKIRVSTEERSVVIGLGKQSRMMIPGYMGHDVLSTSLLWLTIVFEIILFGIWIGIDQDPQGILGDCRNRVFRHLGLLWNWCEHSLLFHRIYLSCIPNCFVHRTQEQGGWCSVVRLLGLVLVLHVDRNFPGIHPLLDSILLCLQARFLALGYVATNPWC